MHTWKDEIHRKIGRNIAMFQRAEACLKYLVFIGSLSTKSKSPSGEDCSIEKQILKKKKEILILTIGQLLTKFFNSSLNNVSQQEHIEWSGGIDIDLRFSYGTPDDQKELRRKLQILKNERNKLAHELFFSWDLKTDDGLANLESDLDRKYEEFLPLTDELVRLSQEIEKIITSSTGKMSNLLQEDKSNGQVVQEKITH